jgi:drug/metabolite transporter (DMT)-like permease
MPPGYRERLRVEGLVMAACGAAGSVALVAFVPASRRWPVNTIAQLAIAAVLFETAGGWAVRRYMSRAKEVPPGEEGDGEPTPLWQLPLIVTVLAAAFVALPETGLPASDKAGWDAGLRVTAGCMIVGLMQAVRWERIVRADERKRGRRYVRLPGSRLVTGTRLGFTRD